MPDPRPREPVEVHYRRVQRAVVALRADIRTKPLAEELVNTLSWLRELKGTTERLMRGIRG